MSGSLVNKYLSIVEKFIGNSIKFIDPKSYPEAKKDLIKHIIGTYFIEDLKEADNLLNEIVKGLGNSLYGFIDLAVVANSRTLVGVSEGLFNMIFEVGLVWDPVLGLPYIPGSSLKGSLRHFMISSLCLRQSTPDDRRVCLKHALKLLGVPATLTRDEERFIVENYGFEEPRELYEFIGEASSGLLIFMDSYPVGTVDGSGRIFEPDIITPHYYRGGKVVEREIDVNPTPIPHVALRPGVIFRVIVAYEDEALDVLDKMKNYIGASSSLEALLKLIGLSLYLNGVGARTGKGYGVFELRKLYGVKHVSFRNNRKR